jgi:hypothetical protein
MKMLRKFGQRVSDSMGGVIEKGLERNADGWTKIEMQTFTFATLPTTLKMFIFFLINCA